MSWLRIGAKFEVLFDGRPAHLHFGPRLPNNLQLCHNQAVEWYVKLVSDPASSVAGFHRQDGLIQQRIASRQLMKTFDTKERFP